MEEAMKGYLFRSVLYFDDGGVHEYKHKTKTGAMQAFDRQKELTSPS
jgi:hypothetical protein